MVIEVDSPDMTAFEEVMESLTGDDANPFIQLLIISLLIAGLVIFIKRGQKRKDSVWDADDLPTIMAPLEAPSISAFGGEEESSVENVETKQPLPLPEDGLPPGWSMEQWEHYGHQYLEMQETVNGLIKSNRHTTLSMRAIRS